MFGSLINTVRKSTSGAAEVAATVDVNTAEAVDPFNTARTSSEAGVDVWVLPREAMARYALFAGQLSAEEQAHAAKLKLDTDRVRYIATRVVLRGALSHRVKNEVESGHWRLTVNAQGKPEIDPAQAKATFSITHADDFSVIAVTADAMLGIDAEKIDDAVLANLPTTCLTAKEAKRLEAKTGEEKRDSFFRTWTLKEAYTKAMGLGFSAEFDRIEFDADRAALTRKAPSAPAGRAAFDIVTLRFNGTDTMLALCTLGGAKSITTTVHVVA